MRRNKKKNSHHIDESWLLPYSDLLTLLLALFIVLFAMSEVDSQKYRELSRVFQNEFSGGQSILEESNKAIELPNEEQEEDKQTEQSANEQELHELQTLQKQMNQYIEEKNLDAMLATQLTDEGLLITILNDVTFDSGSAEVTANGEEIAKELSEFLYTDPPHQIVISGHTDNKPIKYAEFTSNWELSVTRAVNFMHLLLTNEKLDPTRFSAKGFGEHQPTVPNTTIENRAKNRRVEVLILPNYEINTGSQNESTR
ncbi:MULTISPECIES: flagellar motor protein MotB [Virgibacillus]|uniref:Chemotaxis protein MotB n=2 Tax=Virgibacillus TaxID=84406 RepID=A0A024Q9P6_9BACI|nr:hypothetical protein M948_02950 [Virgibacillus sp. CM-4]MYL40272.1 flagellar motor protein MotB [Virgibacillus massiliensis]GGJ60356.1 motility protein B [Virgibacillus kapii]CDQ38962.1 Chemotaxis protein MotB [Virgibacillus massiliensis]